MRPSLKGRDGVPISRNGGLLKITYEGSNGYVWKVPKEILGCTASKHSRDFRYAAHPERVKIDLDDEDEYVTSFSNLGLKKCNSLLEIKEMLCSVWNKSQVELDEMFLETGR